MISYRILTSIKTLDDIGEHRIVDVVEQEMLRCAQLSASPQVAGSNVIQQKLQYIEKRLSMIEAEMTKMKNNGQSSIGSNQQGQQTTINNPSGAMLENGTQIVSPDHDTMINLQDGFTV